MNDKDDEINDFYDDVQQSAHDLAQAFSLKIHEGLAIKSYGQTFDLTAKELLALAITLDTSIRILHTDLINVLASIYEHPVPESQLLANKLNSDLLHAVETRASDFFKTHEPPMADS